MKCENGKTEFLFSVRGICLRRN